MVETFEELEQLGVVPPERRVSLLEVSLGIKTTVIPTGSRSWSPFPLLRRFRMALAGGQID